MIYGSLTLTFNLDPQSQAMQGQGRPHAKNQGQRSNGSSRRAQTNKWTDRQKDKRALPNLLSSCFAIDNNIENQKDNIFLQRMTKRTKLRCFDIYPRAHHWQRNVLFKCYQKYCYQHGNLCWNVMYSTFITLLNMLKALILTLASNESTSRVFMYMFIDGVAQRSSKIMNLIASTRPLTAEPFDLRPWHFVHLCVSKKKKKKKKNTYKIQMNGWTLQSPLFPCFAR